MVTDTRLTLAALLFLAGIFVTIGDVILFQWARENSFVYLAFGLLFNVAGITFYAQTLKLESLGLATAMFLGLNILAVTLAGCFIFGEKIPLRSALGMGLIAVSIFLIEI